MSTPATTFLSDLELQGERNRGLGGSCQRWVGILVLSRGFAPAALTPLRNNVAPEIKGATESRAPRLCLRSLRGLWSAAANSFPQLFPLSFDELGGSNVEGNPRRVEYIVFEGGVGGYRGGWGKGNEGVSSLCGMNYCGGFGLLREFVETCSVGECI